MTTQHAPAVQIHLDRAKSAVDRALAQPLVSGGHITAAIQELEAALSARREAVEAAHDNDDAPLGWLRQAGML
jgi:hypothetical protein